MSWDQLFHSGHLSLSVKVVLDFQQQCSWLNQNPAKHTPSFRSVIQWAEMSIRPAKEPGLKKKKKKKQKNLMSRLKHLKVIVCPTNF